MPSVIIRQLRRMSYKEPVKFRALEERWQPDTNLKSTGITAAVSNARASNRLIRNHRAVKLIQLRLFPTAGSRCGAKRRCSQVGSTRAGPAGHRVHHAASDGPVSLPPECFLHAA